MTEDPLSTGSEADAALRALEAEIAKGLVGIGGDLSEATLLAAYRAGIFPWFSPGEPILWYSPDPRFVLPLESFHAPRSLLRTIARGRFEVRWDTAFAEVIRQCSRASETTPAEPATWIGPEMIAAYEGLAASGYAHSVETWRDGRLVGGLYGVSLGGAFFGESMYSAERDASKVALAALVDRMRVWEMDLLDCQVHTEHLARFGAVDVPRAEFQRRLALALEKPTRRDRWG